MFFLNDKAVRIFKMSFIKYKVVKVLVYPLSNITNKNLSVYEKIFSLNTKLKTILVPLHCLVYPPCNCCLPSLVASKFDLLFSATCIYLSYSIDTSLKKAVLQLAIFVPINFLKLVSSAINTTS